MWEYIKAFDVLSSRRTAGFSINPISMSDIKAYLDIFGCEYPEIFIELLIMMDIEFLRYYNSKRKTK